MHARRVVVPTFVVHAERQPSAVAQEPVCLPDASAGVYPPPVRVRCSTPIENIASVTSSRIGRLRASAWTMQTSESRAKFRATTSPPVVHTDDAYGQQAALRQRSSSELWTDPNRNGRAHTVESYSLLRGCFSSRSVYCCAALCPVADRIAGARHCQHRWRRSCRSDAYLLAGVYKWRKCVHMVS